MQTHEEYQVSQTLLQGSPLDAHNDSELRHLPERYKTKHPKNVQQNKNMLS